MKELSGFGEIISVAVAYLFIVSSIYTATYMFMIDENLFLFVSWQDYLLVSMYYLINFIPFFLIIFVGMRTIFSIYLSVKISRGNINSSFDHIFSLFLYFVQSRIFLFSQVILILVIFLVLTNFGTSYYIIIQAAAIPTFFGLMIQSISQFPRIRSSIDGFSFVSILALSIIFAIMIPTYRANIVNNKTGGDYNIVDSNGNQYSHSLIIMRLSDGLIIKRKNKTMWIERSIIQRVESENERNEEKTMFCQSMFVDCL